MTEYPKKFLYMDKPLEDYSKEELIKIAEEGWKMYHECLQSGIRSVNLLSALYEKRISLL